MKTEKIRALHILMTFVFLFFSFWSSGQVYNGIVLDKRTKEPIPYVNIALLGTYTGTVTQYDGTFRLDLTGKPKDKDSVAFSIIGYEKLVLSIQQLSDGQEILLNPSFVNLESVIVSPKTPEEYIKLSIENIPENYITEPFNGTIYYRTEVRLNGKFIEAQEAIMKGYIMPVTGDIKDTTRLRMMAFKYYDEQEEAISSIKIKKRKKEKVAIDGLDSALIELTYQLSEFFGPYIQIDSNLIKQSYQHGYQEGKEKYWFEKMLSHEGRNFITIGYKGRIDMASQRGNLMLDEENLAIARYNLQIGTANLKLKAIALVLGVGFKRADVLIQFTSIPSEQGWIPDLMDVKILVDMEKNRWFKKDIPMIIEVSSHMSFLDVTVPGKDKCLDGKIVAKKKHLKDQFTSEPENAYWQEYKSLIEQKSKK